MRLKVLEGGIEASHIYILRSCVHWERDADVATDYKQNSSKSRIPQKGMRDGE